MARLPLNGLVASDDDAPILRWFGYPCFSPRVVRDAIAALGEGEELVLEINSDGGYAEDGAEIYAVLAEASRTHNIRAEIQSRACSAASYMALACRRVDISPVGRFMIHRASCWAHGNVDDLAEARQMLSAMDASILDTYCRKCGGKSSEASLARMMARETWITAKEAVAMGLADGIIGDDDNTDDGGMIVVNALGLPNMEQLRKAYRERQSPPPEQNPKPDDNAAKAQRARAIALERLTL